MSEFNADKNQNGLDLRESRDVGKFIFGTRYADNIAFYMQYYLNKIGFVGKVNTFLITTSSILNGDWFQLLKHSFERL